MQSRNPPRLTRAARPPSALSRRVERTLRLNRLAKLNFPGIFLDLTGRQVGPDGVRLECADNPAFRDAAGELSLCALGVLADVTLGAATRIKSGPSARPATVHLALQLTGAPVQGDVAAFAQFASYAERVHARQALSTATLTAGETLLGHASGAFMMLDLPEGTTQTPYPWLTQELLDTPLDAAELDERERSALRACARAENAASAEHPFIDHFWCGVPTATRGKARLTIGVTPHLGNRVGHVHGGILFGAAGIVAGAAAGDGMRLSNLSAWFLSPGQGPRLNVRSSVVHQSRNLAVVRTQIVGAEGRLVLEATSQHVNTRAPVRSA